MSKVSPCLWFDGEAEQAAKFYVSLRPIPESKRSRRTPLTARRQGRLGTGWISRWRAALMALNGGMPSISPTRSRSRSTARSGEVDRLLGRTVRWRIGRALWLLKDRYGVSWQIVPTALVQYLGGPIAPAPRAMQAMMQMVKLDIAGLKNAYEGKSAA